MGVLDADRDEEGDVAVTSRDACPEIILMVFVITEDVYELCTFDSVAGPVV